jgi:hypothetical protein
MLTIVCHVAAEFRDRTGRTVFAVSPSDTARILQAPEEIQEDPLFRLLSGDGTLQAVTSVEEKRRLESDPLAGIDAEGKKISRKAVKDENAAEPSAAVEPGKAKPAGSGNDTENTAAAPAMGRKPVGK